jgi:hypothetical protein
MSLFPFSAKVGSTARTTLRPPLCFTPQKDSHTNPLPAVRALDREPDVHQQTNAAHHCGRIYSHPQANRWLTMELGIDTEPHQQHPERCHKCDSLSYLSNQHLFLVIGLVPTPAFMRGVLAVACEAWLADFLRSGHVHLLQHPERRKGFVGNPSCFRV